MSFNSREIVENCLRKLRWSVSKNRPVELGADFILQILRGPSNVHENAAPLVLQLRHKKSTRIVSRSLYREHIETRGKSPWLTDNTWRLSERGIQFFTPGLVEILDRAKLEGEK